MHLSLRMNGVHVSIADPFIHFPNELPLAYLHSELNMMLLSLDTPWPRDAAHYSKLQSRTQQEHEAGDPPAAASPDGGKRVQQSSGRAGEFGEEDVVIQVAPPQAPAGGLVGGLARNPMISRMASHSLLESMCVRKPKAQKPAPGRAQSLRAGATNEAASWLA